jgi:RNA polymerase sigma factor (sigma-70 family)
MMSDDDLDANDSSQPDPEVMSTFQLEEIVFLERLLALPDTRPDPGYYCYADDVVGRYVRRSFRSRKPEEQLAGRSSPYNICGPHSSSPLGGAMGQPLSITSMSEQDRQISEIIAKERSRLRNFIRRRVPDPADVEDIVQDVFYRLLEANRLLMPIEHVTGWLFRVARNRITDLFRKKKPELFSDAAVEDEEGELMQIDDLLPSPDAGPDALYLRHMLLDELELALDELPDEQREVFVAHELEGRSFREIAEESGVSVNTLLSRKRYAVLHLRERLQHIHDEFTKP